MGTTSRNAIFVLLGLATIQSSKAQELPVTGSHIAGVPSLQPLRVIDRAELEASGYATFGDFLQRLPEQGGAEGPNVNNGGDGSTQLGLHNLTPARTLVLVDGKRWVSHSPAAFGATDLSTIPTEAIERIEILESGGSAAYGTGAIGGVVNLITRKRSDGTEASALGSLSSRGDARQYNLSVTSGLSGDKSSFFFGAGYGGREALLSGARGFATSQLAYNVATGGASRLGSPFLPAATVEFSPGCTTKVCQDLQRAFGVADRGYVAAGACAGCVDGFRPATAADLYNTQEVNDLMTPSQQLSLFSNAEVRFSPIARAYFQGSFVNRQSNNLVAAAPLQAEVPASDPGNPFGVQVEGFRRMNEAGGRSSGDNLDTLRGVAGIAGGLPTGLTFDLSFNYGRSSDTNTSNGTFQTNLIGTGKLLAPAGTLTPADLAAMGLHTGISQSLNQEASTRLDVTQTLFSLGPAREATLAAGYEYRAEFGSITPDPIAAAGQTTDFSLPPVRGGFHANEGYAELDVPVLTELDLRGAVRAVNDSGFGTIAVWSVGGQLVPPDWQGLNLHGSLSSNYREPSILERFDSALTAGNCVSFCPGPVRTGNPALQPEKSLNGTVGISVEPPALRGLLVTLDYWNIAANQLIAPNGAYANTGGEINTSSLDLGLRYAQETPAGRFGLRGNFLYLLRYDTSAAFSEAGNYGAGALSPTGGVTPRLKFDAAVDWKLADLAATLSSRFIGGFDDCRGDCIDEVVHHVPAYATFDLTAAYKLGGTSLTAGVHNLANAVPPKIYDSFLTFADPTYDFVGRAFYARATQRF
jgi:outer membrane receptor protein involved in Fe transport